MTGLTILVLAASIALVLFNLLVRAGALAVGLKWMRSPKITWQRLLAEFVIISPLSAGYLWASSQLETARQPPIIEYGGIATFVAVHCLVISTLFRIRFGRAFVAWLSLTVISAACAFVMALVIRANLAEAFRVTSSAMSPTLLGEHLIGTCPTCGSRTIIPPSALQFADDPMICVEHFHVSRAAVQGDALQPPDRMLVLKTLAPKRWDLAVFTPPDREDDPQFYVMRIVGLPGETITIREGTIFVGESAAPLPPHLSEIRYSGEDADLRTKLPGDPSKPAILGADEYFVLGDFSPRSRDSRYWAESGSARPSYALPSANLHGIVTHIYWPPSRWRAFR
jgi:signal peptidase I